MKPKIYSLFLKYGSILCSIAVVVMRFGVLSCRGQFYQPKKPENLKKLLEGEDKNV